MPQLARRDAEAAGLENIDYAVGDARHLKGGDYDVVYSRYLLAHLADPERVVDRLVGLARAGGVVAIEDADFGGAFCHPADPAVQRFGALHRQLIRRRGGDPEIGRRLPLMLQDAGLIRTGFEIVQRAFMQGAAKALACRTFENTRDALLQEGLASPEEIAHLRAALTAYVADPRTLICGPRVVQAWGWKPQP